MNKLIKRLNLLISDTRANITVETALILPILILFAMGTVELTLALNHKMQLSNAARAGMQYGMVRKPIDGDFTGIEAAVRTAAPDTTGLSVSGSLYCKCLVDGSDSECTVNSGATNTEEDVICSDGNLRASYLRIVIKSEYQTLLNYPGVGTDGVMGMKEEVIVRLNGGVAPET